MKQTEEEKKKNADYAAYFQVSAQHLHQTQYFNENEHWVRTQQFTIENKSHPILTAHNAHIYIAIHIKSKETKGMNMQNVKPLHSK